MIDRIVAARGEFPLQRTYTDAGPVDRAGVDLPAPPPAEPYQIPLLVPSS